MMTMLLWSCNGIRNKTHLLESLIKLHNYEIIVLTETNLAGHIHNSELRLPSYEIIRRDRATAGGGVLIAIKRSKRLRLLLKWCSPTEEFIALKVGIANTTISLLAYYRPPNYNCIDALADWFEDSVEPNLILTGDFNLPELSWNQAATKKQTRPIARDFQELIAAQGLTQIVDCPTHDKGNTLDLFLTNLEPLPTLKTIDTKLSDHSALTFNISSLLPQLPSTKLPPNKSPFYVFSKANLGNITEDMQQLKSTVKESIKNKHNIDDIWQLIKDTIITSSENHIPTFSVNSNKHWLTDSTKQILRKKQHLYKTFRSYPTKQNKELLAELNILSRKLVKQD